jgi:hypothetical protein
MAHRFWKMRCDLGYWVGSNVVLPAHIFVPPRISINVRTHFAEGVGLEVSRTNTLFSSSPGDTIYTNRQQYNNLLLKSKESRSILPFTWEAKNTSGLYIISVVSSSPSPKKPAYSQQYWGWYHHEPVVDLSTAWNTTGLLVRLVCKPGQIATSCPCSRTKFGGTTKVLSN